MSASKESVIVFNQDLRVEGVEVLWNGQYVPPEHWSQYGVRRCDLLDALSGTRMTEYQPKGTLVIQRKTVQEKK